MDVDEAEATIKFFVPNHILGSEAVATRSSSSEPDPNDVRALQYDSEAASCLEHWSGGSAAVAQRNRTRACMPGYMLLLAMVVSLFSIDARCEEPYPKIELRVDCLNGYPCRFSGDTIRVELELTNASGEDVALPVEYFRKQGTQVVLVDNHSNKEKRLGMGPPMS